MNQIKEEILEQFEEVDFISGADDKLRGYAEMNGNDCILLYEGINFTPYNPSEAIEKIQYLNPIARTHDDSDKSIIGHLKLEDDTTILLYDKESLIEGIKQTYMEDNTGLFENEEDCEESAIEWYYFNSLGTYMEGIPAFAVLYSK